MTDNRDTPDSLSANVGSPASDAELSLLDLAIVLAKFKKRICLLTVAGALAGLFLALSKPNIYTASTRILPPQQAASSAAALMSSFGGAVGALGGVKNPSDLYVAMLSSRTLGDAVIARFDLARVFGTDNPTDTRGALRSVLTIAAGKDGVISVDVDHVDPKFAAELANGYIEEFYKMTQELAVTEASRRRLFIEQQLKLAKERLAVAEVAMRELQEKSGITALSEQSSASIQSVARMRGLISAKEAQIQSMRVFATGDNPDLKFAEAELASLRTQLSKLEKGEPGDVLVPPSKIPGAGLEYIRRLREVKYAEVVFEALAKQYEVARIEEGKNASLIQVLDKAVVPDHKSKPKRSVIVMVWTFAAFAIAILSAFLAEAARRTRQDPAQAERLKALRDALRWRRRMI